MFGCGENIGGGFVLNDEVAATSAVPRTIDRLRHMDEIDRDTRDGALDAHGRDRRSLLIKTGLAGVLAAIGPAFNAFAAAANAPTANRLKSPSPRPAANTSTHV